MIPDKLRFFIILSNSKIIIFQEIVVNATEMADEKEDSTSNRRNQRKRLASIETFPPQKEDRSKRSRSKIVLINNTNQDALDSSDQPSSTDKRPVGRPRRINEVPNKPPKISSSSCSTSISVSNKSNTKPIPPPAIPSSLPPHCAYTIDEFIHALRTRECKKISFLVGAGISVGAGIPDFRSPQSGLYAQVKKLGLPHPEDIFQLDSFQDNPYPLYFVAKQFFFSSQAQPVAAHHFMKSIEQRKCLHFIYTQNIDSLEVEVGIAEKKIVQAHGHLRSAHCCQCHRDYPVTTFFAAVQENRIVYCSSCQTSDAIVKPQIIMFGERLPRSFQTKLQQIHRSDLVIIMGTSLKVQPFSTLLQSIDETIPIVVINRDFPTVSSLVTATREDDGGKLIRIPRTKVLFLQGDIQEIVSDLMNQLQWTLPPPLSPLATNTPSTIEDQS